MPSPEFVAALAHFPKDLAVPGDSYEVVRQKFGPAHGHDPGPDIVVEPARFGGVEGVWVARKEEPAPADTIFFVHGGAFVSCPAPSYSFYAAWLVRATGARAFVVDYRLAPEHRFPAALDDCVAAWSSAASTPRGPPSSETPAAEGSRWPHCCACATPGFRFRRVPPPTAAGSISR
jgi:acetyl esterase/lipase